MAERTVPPVARGRVAPLASLARIGLSPAEERSLEREFAAILDFVRVVERVAGGAPRPPRATITGVQHILREDRVEPSVLADVLLRQAPEQARGFVKVPPIL